MGNVSIKNNQYVYLDHLGEISFFFLELTGSFSSVLDSSELGSRV